MPIRNPGLTIAARAWVRAATFCCALGVGPAGTAPVVSVPTLTPASAPAAKESLSVSDPTGRAYAPQYLPKEVQFTTQELS